MIWLILGVALWWAAHFFKRAAPGLRARMGDRGRGAVTGVLLISIVLMVVGYRAADTTFYWGRSPALVGINNLLVLIGFYLFAASGAKTWVARHYRHPQLTGFALWAFAHLLVNGDTKSFVLFGGLLVWALAEMVVINRAEPTWTPPPEGPVRKEFTAAIAAVVLYVVVALLHGWIGSWPFG